MNKQAFKEIAMKKQKQNQEPVFDRLATLSHGLAEALPAVLEQQLQPPPAAVELAPARPLPPHYDTANRTTLLSRVKVPSVVVRRDGRFGVAYPSCFAPKSVAADGGSGFVHEAQTHRTRLEAEQRAWRVARELATTTWWP